MKKIINTLLAIGFIIATMLHFYPFAIWNDFTLTLLRFGSAFCIQLLLCRVVKNKGFKVAPTVSAVLFALWSTWLFLTSPDWHSATVELLLTHHYAPAIGCLVSWIIFIAFNKNTKN